jgi:hypothetical protein
MYIAGHLEERTAEAFLDRHFPDHARIRVFSDAILGFLHIGEAGVGNYKGVTYRAPSSRMFYTNRRPISVIEGVLIDPETFIFGSQMIRPPSDLEVYGLAAAVGLWAPKHAVTQMVMSEAMIRLNSEQLHLQQSATALGANDML